MRIAITVDPMLPVPPPLYGGVERIMDLLVRGLVDRGHDVTLFAHPDSDVPCRHVPFRGTDPRDLVDTVRNTLTLSRLAVSRPDVIHSASRLAYLTPLLPLNIPKIMNYHRLPAVQQVQKAMRLARSDSLAFTGVSQHIADRIRPYAPAYAVYNAVPMDTYDFQPDVPPDAPLTFLGRIEPIKGTHVAIEVARRTGRDLVIAGNVADEHEAYFSDRIQPEVDGDQIHYIGTVNDAEKNDMLGASAAFLMPIDWEEPFGLVMAEAMACGTPVVGLRRGAVEEVVDHGTTGFVCDTVDEMVAAVRCIDAIDRADCRARCEDRFSQTALVDAYERVYKTRIAALRS
jgi:glycosyltransferase involved in cell wall biosynthesis